MSEYKYLTVHCSATLPLDSIDADVIRKMHTDKGWSDIGYHYVIKANGSVQRGRPISRMGAHVKGHNKNNLGVCMVGGVDESGNSANNFTSAQYSALRWFIIQQTGIHGIKQENIMGHRDWFKDKNGDGVIDRQDWLKDCPCFNVKMWFKSVTED